MTASNVWRLTVASAVLYAMSAICFVWAALRDGGLAGITGSLLFLTAALVLFVPLVAGRPGRTTECDVPSDPSHRFDDPRKG